MSTFIAIPVVAIVISILVRYTPLMTEVEDNSHEAVRFFAVNHDFNFHFALNYNFQVLKPETETESTELVS